MLLQAKLKAQICLFYNYVSNGNLYFGWGTEQSGTFLAILGCLVLPLNFLIGTFSRKFDDRTMMLAMQIGVLIGLVVLLLHTHIHTAQTHLGQFVTGGVIAFSCSSMLEGVTMSLLSKVVPPSLARGTFNSGLLATEAGTFGRAVGDMLVTLVGASLPSQDMLEALNVPNFVLSTIVLVFINRYYALLY